MPGRYVMPLLYLNSVSCTIYPTNGPSRKERSREKNRVHMPKRILGLITLL